MPRIHLLEDQLINKIAAGEVVERPASVVKELVENAIDAEASEVRVELREGGKELIVVTDDGLGIAAEDASLAVRRHATSKISHQDDLFAIDTLGFRGEALASIASVSRFSLMTRQKDASFGMKVDVEDGKVLSTEWQGRVGTTITVKDLFHSLPVRKGFLKRSASEFAVVLEYLQAMALNIPDVGFTLIHNDKEQLRVPPIAVAEHDYFRGEEALRGRAQAILGAQAAEKLVYCQAEDKHGMLEALISAPGQDRPTSKNIYTFVNGRWVKDKTLRYGILRGYHSHLLKGRFPCAILHMSIDPSLVDVNVHPTKTELRFQYQSEVQVLIANLVRENLRSGAWAKDAFDVPDKKDEVAQPENREPSRPKPAPVPLDFDLGPSSGSASRPKPAPVLQEFDLGPSGPSSRPKPAPMPQEFDLGSSGSTSSPKPAPVPLDFGSSRSAPSLPKAAKPRDMSITESRQIFRGPSHTSSQSGGFLETPIAKTTPPEISWSSLNYVGSFANCYLFFDLGDRLLAVDQHAFHERILYERFTNDYKSLGDSERLIMPEGIDLEPQAYSCLEQHQDELKSKGFDLKFMGDSLVEVQALPSLLKECHMDRLLSELAESFSKDDMNIAETEISHRVLSTMACHAAVRAGERLGVDDVHNLQREAENVDFFLNCPHGRKVFKTFQRKEVEAWFDR